MVKAKVYRTVKQFTTYPELSDFELIEEDLPPIKDGEFLAEAVYISVDPYARYGSVRIPLGVPVIGDQIARILESKNPKFPVGKLVLGTFGWRTHTISDGITIASYSRNKILPYVLPDYGNLPPTIHLGTLGFTGTTAYFGLLEVIRPKAGETLVVSTAAGATGSAAAQIGKIFGCKVIGITSTDEKCKWITEELGLDHAINYKTQDVDSELSRLAPEGVDGYFDNVGGEILSIVVRHLNYFGRVAIIGVTSKYNYEHQSDFSLDGFRILSRDLKIEGLVVNNHLDKWNEGIKQLHEWVKEGKIKSRETITKGFENTFDAFLNMLQGGNIGKAIVEL